MSRWEQILVGPELPLEQAIATLDREGLRIALVVDEQRHLLGTLTDGDVRRALLRHVPLDVAVKTVMYTSPITAQRDWSNERVLALMEQHQLLQIPVLDEERRVTGLETLHGLLRKRRRDNPVFLMAGGFGTRLQPLTNHCPKPLLRVGNKPILEMIVEKFVDSGFHRFFISTHYMPEMIREQIGDGSRWGVKVQYVHEQEPLGTAGSLGLLPAAEVDLPLFVMNGDLLTNLDFQNVLAFHQEHAAAATMCVREYEHRVPYGVIQSEGHHIRAMVEKPVYRHFINAGIYLLAPELVRRVQPGTRIDMPTLLEQEIAQGRTVNMFPVHEYWLDIGRMEDFQRAQTEAGQLT
jgi:dTDP-glucose pyrophosphorylase